MSIDPLSSEYRRQERVARAIWAATGHRETDWAYMAPEIPRKRRYMAYAAAAIEALEDES
jgi:hypothetical protein